ncbi:MAG: LEA type 2 family protein, partial [Bacteroidetes bacterium]|nr:LEA type 2 family protein [Bacteroidota bacterium]
NKNFFPISFKDPTYALDLGSQEQMARGQVQSLTRVEGRSSNTYTIPLSIDMGDLLKATGQLIAQGKNLPFTLHFSCTLTADNEMFNNSEVKLVVEGTMEDLKTAQENLGD